MTYADNSAFLGVAVHMQFSSEHIALTIVSRMVMLSGSTTSEDCLGHQSNIGNEHSRHIERCTEILHTANFIGMRSIHEQCEYRRVQAFVLPHH